MIRRHLLIVVVVIAAAIPAPASEGSELVLWATEATRRVEPSDAPESSNRIFSSARSEVRLRAARRESEGFHLVVTATATTLSGLDLQVSPLSGSAGSIPAEQISLFLFRETFFPIAEISRVWGHPAHGETGLKPDALIPFADPYGSGQDLGAPFDVPAGTSQPLWVLIEVPAATAPGSYSATLSVRRRTDTGLAHYLVQRSEQSGGPYRTINPNQVVTEPRYLDREARGGQSLFYVVRSEDLAGNTGPPSSELAVSTGSAPTPRRPSRRVAVEE